jgi:hypothetical protein
MNETFLDQQPTETQTPTVPAAPAAPTQDTGPSIDALLQEDETPFLQKLAMKVNRIIRDPKNSLTGSARLTAELIARNGLPLLPQSFYRQIRNWDSEWLKLQKCIDSHGDDAAFVAWDASERNLHNDAQEPGHAVHTVISRDEFHAKFEQIRGKCFQRQQALYVENIKLARAAAETAAELLRNHAVELERTEREKYAKYGLTYNGSPLVAAVKQAEKFVLSRTAPIEGACGPSLALPWLIL